MSGPELLFSYGTLQLKPVQLGNFGRELAGRADALCGYKIEEIEILDATVVELSGKTHHFVVHPSGDLGDEVAGIVFEISYEELLAADGYETDDYVRVSAKLKSGKEAWVYVKA